MNDLTDEKKETANPKMIKPIVVLLERMNEVFSDNKLPILYLGVLSEELLKSDTATAAQRARRYLVKSINNDLQAIEADLRKMFP